MVSWISVSLGLLLGSITGLIPGIHPNLVATVLGKTGFEHIAIIIFTTAVVHTFLNTIPSIHLSTPDPESFLALHPSQIYAAEGKAHEAVLLTVIGSFTSLVLTIILAIALQQLIKPTFSAVKAAIPFLILIVALFMIVTQKRKIKALIIFLASGILGYTVLNTFQINEPLLPLFTGLFGIPSLLVSINESNIKQKITTPKLETKDLRVILSGIFFGSLFSFLPALGAAQAAAVQSKVTKIKSKQAFLLLVGGLNTVNIIFSIITLIEINKARNGAVAVIKQVTSLTQTEAYNLLLIALLLAFPCVLACLYYSRLFIIIKNKIPTKKLSLSIIFFLIIISLLLSSWQGIIVLTIATAVGLIPYKWGTTKTTLMGSLMIPTLVFYFSIMF